MTDTLIHGLYREGEKIADTKAPHDVPIAAALGAAVKFDCRARQPRQPP